MLKSKLNASDTLNISKPAYDIVCLNTTIMKHFRTLNNRNWKEHSMMIYLIWIVKKKKKTSYWEEHCSAAQAFGVENSRFDWHKRVLVLYCVFPYWKFMASMAVKLKSCIIVMRHSRSLASGKPKKWMYLWQNISQKHSSHIVSAMCDFSVDISSF